jgi:hypothetical protein
MEISIYSIYNSGWFYNLYNGELLIDSDGPFETEFEAYTSAVARLNQYISIK